MDGGSCNAEAPCSRALVRREYEDPPREDYVVESVSVGILTGELPYSRVSVLDTHARGVY